MLDEERDIMDEEVDEEADLSDDGGVDLGDDLLLGEEEAELSLSHSGAKGLDE